MGYEKPMSKPVKSANHRSKGAEIRGIHSAVHMEGKQVSYMGTVQ